MNRNTFAKDGKSIILVPLSPIQVYEDKLKLKRETEAEGSENTNKANERERERKKESHKERKIIYLTKKIKEIILAKSEGKHEKRRKCGKIKTISKFLCK